jgi:hypothetical protein
MKAGAGNLEIQEVSGQYLILKLNKRKFFLIPYLPQRVTCLQIPN